MNPVCRDARFCVSTFFTHFVPKIGNLLMEIYPAIEKVDENLSEEDFHKEAIKQNVEYQAKDLLIKDAYIEKKVETGEIMVVKANYNLKTSEVEIF